MKFDKEKMRLYAITDRHWLNGRSLKEVVKESLDGGVTFLQLRDKNSDDETFLQEAAELQELCRDYKVPQCGNCFEDECRWCSCRAE